ncbi:MAG: TSUP family transporter [Natronospirillum sp.]
MVAGFIDTLAGGGGLIVLPALLLAQVPPIAALATNKLQGSFGTLTSSFRMLRSGLVTWQQVKWLFFASVIGSAVGTILVQMVDVRVLDVIIPVVLVSVAIYYLVAPKAQTDTPPKMSEETYRTTVAPGIGFYDGFFGPGTGSLFAFSRNVLRAENLIQATAKAKLMNFASNIVSLLIFAFSGHIIWLLGLVMIGGQMIGAWAGSHMIIGGKISWIRPLIVVMCIGMAARYVWTTFL